MPQCHKSREAPDCALASGRAERRPSSDCLHSGQRTFVWSATRSNPRDNVFVRDDRSGLTRRDPPIDRPEPLTAAACRGHRGNARYHRLPDPTEACRSYFAGAVWVEFNVHRGCAAQVPQVTASWAFSALKSGKAGDSTRSRAAPWGPGVRRVAMTPGMPRSCRRAPADRREVLGNSSANLAMRPYYAPARIIRDAFSPIMIDGAFVFPDVSVGMIDASATRRPRIPCTRNCSSTTAIGSWPILQVPTGW
jgi:hypothetical protein